MPHPVLQAPVERSDVPDPTGDAQRPRWLLPVAALAVAAAVGAAIILGGNDSLTPEEVVAEHHAAYNARDVEALRSLISPYSVFDYDASRVGFDEFSAETVGLEAILDSYQEAWPDGVSFESHEVLAVDGGTVTTTETLRFSDGFGMRHSVTYQVTTKGLILRQVRVVEQMLEPTGS